MHNTKPSPLLDRKRDKCKLWNECQLRLRVSTAGSISSIMWDKSCRRELEERVSTADLILIAFVVTVVMRDKTTRVRQRVRVPLRISIIINHQSLSSRLPLHHQYPQRQSKQTKQKCKGRSLDSWTLVNNLFCLIV